MVLDTLLKLKGIIVYISYINNKPIDKAKGKFLVYWDPVSKISVNFILIIIITNKNSTAIAPDIHYDVRYTYKSYT